jgi:hypothetical protein
MLLEENILKLGIVIIFLSLILGILFWGIKKQIDHINHERLYLYAVAGYIISWVLRANLGSEMDTYLLYINLLFITFFSQLFRLTFNKRFFYIARLDNPIRYIACRAFYAQISTFLFFVFLGGLASLGKDPINQLQIIFYIAIPLSFLYFIYRKNKTN